MLLQTSIVVSKWVECEADIRRMKKRAMSGRVEEMEQQLLPGLYLDSLMLVSSIYKSGKTRLSRVGMLFLPCTLRSLDAHSVD